MPKENQMNRRKITALSLCALISLGACNKNESNKESPSVNTGNSQTTESNRPTSESNKPSESNKKTDIKSNKNDSLRRLVVDAKPKRSYHVGEAITYDGMIVMLENVDTGEREDTTDYLCDPEEGTILNEVGTFTVTVKSPDKDIIPATFKIIVDEAQEDLSITRLEVKTNPTTTEYYEGQAFKSEGLVVNKVHYVNNVKRESEITTDYTLSIQNGDILNTVSSALEVKVISKDPNVESASFYITVYEKEETDPTRKSLAEVMNVLKASKNLTFTTTNSLRGSTVTKKFTEKAMYFDSTQSGIGHYGYAEQKDGKVFRYTYDSDGSVKAGLVERDEDKNQITGLYSGKGIKTFHDIDVTTLPTEIITGNTYEMDDIVGNQDNLAALVFLLGYEDGSFTLSDITRVRFTVQKGDLLKVEVKFRPSYSSSMDTLIGVVSDMGTTTLSKINTYLANGGQAKVIPALPDKFRTKLEAVSSDMNYTYSVKRLSLNASDELVPKLDFVDQFTDYAIYTTDNLDSRDSIGYSVFQNKVFSYTVEGDGIIAGDFLTENGSYIYGLENGVHSFLDIDLYCLDYKTIDDNTIQILDDNTLNVLSFTTLRTNYRSSSFNLNKVTLSINTDGNMVVDFDYGANGYAKGIISDIGTTSLSNIKSYLDQGKGPNDSSSKDTLKDVIQEMKKSNNYSEDLGYTNEGKHIGTTYYLPYAVFTDYDEVNKEDTGFIDHDSGIYQFSVNTDKDGNRTLVLGDCAKENSSLSKTRMYPTSLSVFDDDIIDLMEYNSPNKAFLTTDATAVGEVCDFMGMGDADMKKKYTPYSCGFQVKKDQADISNSTLALCYVVSMKDANNVVSYGMLTNTYSNFGKADQMVSFIGDFKNA